MNKKLALQIILAISLAGMIFSGYLSYEEIVCRTCPLGDDCSTLFGIPTCFYGFVMYACVFAVTLFSLRSEK